MAVVLYSRVVDCYFCMGYVIHIDASNFEIKIKIANDYTFQYCFFFPQPFAVHGTLTPESNVSFDASLRQRFVLIILCVKQSFAAFLRSISPVRNLSKNSAFSCMI